MLQLIGYNLSTNGMERRPAVKKISLITDGSCLGNPGPGGWAAILRFAGKTRELFG